MRSFRYSSALLPACHAAPSTTTRRMESFYGKIHRLTKIRLAGSKEKQKQQAEKKQQKEKQYTSKDVPTGPQHGAGFDPVYSYHRMQDTTGPLRRKTSGTTPEDYLEVGEAEKWMDAKQAAKVLGLKESNLSNLTRGQIDDAWRKVYKEKSNAHQTEVLIAAEILLEYLDSSTYAKKSKQYYRQLLDTARSEIDFELKKVYRDRSEKFIYFFGFIMLAASGAILFIAYTKDAINNNDLRNMGSRTQDFFTMTFMQPKNLEPAPDYSTRYLRTPTAIDIDKAKGLQDHQFRNSEELRYLEERREYDRREEAALIEMLNEENQKLLAKRKAGDTENIRGRVRIHRPEDLQPQEMTIPTKEETAANPPEEEKSAPPPKKKVNHYSFKEFAEMLSVGFGGGSRIQRLTEETSQRAKVYEDIQRRMGKEEEEKK
ncbi:hypothetical protein AGDE_10295 [Angomonas deanei]|nr:hypothetical protein AGDE_10295 [Angomonas deanei]|eukprot:EPY28762.1 hypothetical protein AGDE_10295 [Angomonas deanei]